MKEIGRSLEVGEVIRLGELAIRRAGDDRVEIGGVGREGEG